jgi:hypothetical protein
VVPSSAIESARLIAPVEHQVITRRRVLKALHTEGYANYRPPLRDLSCLKFVPQADEA